MMKPHEETWEILPRSIEEEFSLLANGACVGIIACDDARAKLAAQAPAMARLLLRTKDPGEPGEGPITSEFDDERERVLLAAGVLE